MDSRQVLCETTIAWSSHLSLFPSVLGDLFTASGRSEREGCEGIRHPTCVGPGRRELPQEAPIGRLSRFYFLRQFEDHVPYYRCRERTSKAALGATVPLVLVVV